MVFRAPLIDPLTYTVRYGESFVAVDQHNASLTLHKYEYINDTPITRHPPFVAGHWKLGIMDTDEANRFNGFYSYYEYTARSFNRTLTEQAYGFTIRHGGWTTPNSDGNQFSTQVPIAWGNINSEVGYLAPTNPVVSYVWAWPNGQGEPSNPPVANIAGNTK
jgi:hypothetical protein